MAAHKDALLRSFARNFFLLRISFFWFSVIISLNLTSPYLALARWSLTPRVYVEENYDDNIFLTKTNKQDDFITTVSPGAELKYETPTRTIAMDYEYRQNYYRDFTDLDFSGHRGSLTARMDFSPLISAGLSEILIRSEDPIELTGQTAFERPSIRVGERNRYTRNILEPDFVLNFGERSSVRIGYRNMILRNDADDVADQDENVVNVLLSHRVSIHHGLELFYEHLNEDYGSTTPPSPISDLKGDGMRGRYTYYLDPITSFFAELRYYNREYDVESPDYPDYAIYNPRLGFSRDFLENLSLNASAGYVLRKADRADDQDAFSGRLDLLGRFKRLNAEVYAETGFGEDVTSAEALGFYEFWRTGLNTTYQLLERLTVRAFLYVQRENYADLDRKDTFYNARGTLAYQLFRWLYLSFDYERNERDSTISLNNFTDNRYFLRITFQKNVAEYFQ